MNIVVIEPVTLLPIAVVDVYESSIWSDRYCACGDFEIYTPVSNEMLDIFKDDNYLVLEDDSRGMIVEAREITHDIEEGSKLVVTGRSFESILDRRIIWGQKALAGNFQDGVEELLNDCIISPTDTSRRIDNFIFESSVDSRITALTIDSQYMGDNLLTVIKALCEANNLGFVIKLIGGSFVFSLYMGVDRSYAQIENPYVVFSPDFDNILNSNYLESKKNLKTMSLVGGEGEGSDRTLTDIGGSEVGMYRREIFTDASDVSSVVDDITIPVSEYEAQLKQKGTELLSENTYVQLFEGNVETTILFKYDVDFFLGDIVQISNEYGIESTSRVTEIVKSKNVSGTEMYPTFTKID